MAGTLPNFNKNTPWDIAKDFIDNQNKEIANKEYMTHQMNMKTGANIRETAESDAKPTRRYQEASALNQANLEGAQNAEAAGLGQGGRYRTGKSGGADPEIFGEFMEGVKEKGITNPYALAVIAGTGQVESGFSKGNAYRKWSDPSVSGQSGTSGLIMSWRGDRLNKAIQYGKQNGEDMPSPRTQGKFLVDENPEMAKQLQNAGSLAEAQKIINNNWKFAGYDTGGGSTKARFDASSSFLKQFGANPMTAKERNTQSATLGSTEPQKTVKYDPDGKEYFELTMDADGFKKIRSGVPGSGTKLVPDLSQPVGPRGQMVVKQYTGKVNTPAVTPAAPSIIQAPGNKPTEVVKARGYDGSEEEL